jgi:hypothetical protein
MRKPGSDTAEAYRFKPTPNKLGLIKVLSNLWASSASRLSAYGGKKHTRCPDWRCRISDTVIAVLRMRSCNSRSCEKTTSR